MNRKHGKNEISPHFFRKLRKISQKLLSAAVEIGALRFNTMSENVCPAGNISLL